MMFGFFTRPARTGRPSPKRQARLAVEPLEPRDSPSAPEIPLDLALLDEPMAWLNGTVVDEHPETVIVPFSGAVLEEIGPDEPHSYNPAIEAESEVIGLDEWDSYDLGIEANALMAVHEQAVDGEEHASDTAADLIPSPLPALTLSVSYGPGQTVILSGWVTDGDAAGRTVTFSGAVTGTAVTEADGTFSLMVEAAQLGLVQATTEDAWGQVADTAEATVTSAAPVISDFQVTRESGDTWTFQGRVTDENAVGLEVRLGGIPSLMGQTATVDESGWFFLRLTLEDDEEGTVTAQTTDCWGLESDVAEVPVRQN